MVPATRSVAASRSSVSGVLTGIDSGSKSYSVTAPLMPIVTSATFPEKFVQSPASQTGRQQEAGAGGGDRCVWVCGGDGGESNERWNRRRVDF